MVPLDQATRLRIEVQFVELLEDGPDPLEERPVQKDLVVVCSELGGVLAADSLHLRVRHRRDEVEEGPGSPIQRLTRPLERDERVLERRGIGLLGNGEDLLPLLRHPRIERRSEVVILDPVEVRHLERKRALAEQGIHVYS